jgi:hypothetical protein
MLRRAHVSAAEGLDGGYCCPNPGSDNDLHTSPQATPRTPPTYPAPAILCLDYPVSHWRALNAWMSAHVLSCSSHVVRPAQCELNALFLPRHGSIPTPGSNPGYCRHSLHLRARVGLSICSASDLHISIAIASICCLTHQRSGSTTPAVADSAPPPRNSSHLRLHHRGDVVLMTCCQGMTVLYGCKGCPYKSPMDAC